MYDDLGCESASRLLPSTSTITIILGYTQGDSDVIMFHIYAS